MRENKSEQVRSKERMNLFVSKHTSKTENSRLHNSRLVSSVNKPTSVGIEFVILLLSVGNR